VLEYNNNKEIEAIVKRSKEKILRIRKSLKSLKKTAKNILWGPVTSN